MPTILLNSKVSEGQPPSPIHVNVRELSIDTSTGSLWTKLKTGLIRKVLAMASPHAETHAAGQADAITPASIGAAVADHQHTPLDLIGLDFAASVHSHPIGQVSGLSAQLDALAQRVSALEQELHPQ